MGIGVSRDAIHKNNNKPPLRKKPTGPMKYSLNLISQVNST